MHVLCPIYVHVLRAVEEQLAVDVAGEEQLAVDWGGAGVVFVVDFLSLQALS